MSMTIRLIMALAIGAAAIGDVAVWAGGGGEASAAAAALQSPRRDCFSARSVNGFTPVGREAVDVRVSRDRQYRLTLAGYCPDVDWSLRIALRTRGGSSFICAGFDAEIIVPSATGPQRCAVTEVRRLTPEEIAAGRRR
jgi:hypothetical protein